MPMPVYRMKITLDFDAMDDVEARERAEELLRTLRGQVLPASRTPFQIAKANCVAIGDRQDRNVLRDGSWKAE
ncbi:MAG: hypothetical protein HYZ53_20740 [Planctomycetes bacterium]|nr:hypothetical protein [Planctomycetota bacterium]